MRIGIPREIKVREGRVALIPDAVADLVCAGSQVFIESGAGQISGFNDEHYRAAGAEVVSGAPALYERAELIVKVKEPQPAEWPYLRSDHHLFCFLHLAAEKELARQLLDVGLTAFAFETVEEANGRLPILAPMSEIAGRLSAQNGAYLLTSPGGGKGILMGGLAGSSRANVIVLGAGHAGSGAALVAASLGARVTVFDLNLAKLKTMQDAGQHIETLYAHKSTIAAAVEKADLVIGAILLPGHRAPVIVSQETVQRMAPGSVVMDIAVDQGSCIETVRPTTHETPTYFDHQILHYGVTNIPGAVPITSTRAISAAVLPYVLQLANSDWRENASLVKGINVEKGELVHPALQGLL